MFEADTAAGFADATTYPALFPDLEPKLTVRRRPAHAHDPAPTLPPVPMWPLSESMTVVLFAGLGGSDRGLEDAGYPVNLALNHDEIALAAHRALNPHTRQLRADTHFLRHLSPLAAICP